MIKKKWMLNVLYLIITCITFSLSVFKMDNPIWIAAWIAPVFLIRFIRNNKWVFAVIFGFIILQLAVFLGLSSMMNIMNMNDTEILKMDFLSWLILQVKSGLLFLAPLVLIPFIIDKALYNKLPKFAVTLIYPSSVVTFELLSSLIYGTFNTFGESQYILKPLVMTISLFGIFGLSFIIAWFASMINFLWEEKWNFKNLGYSGLIYIVIMAALLIYGGSAIVFTKKADKNVAIAGITLDNKIYDSMSKSDLYYNELINLNPVEYANLMSSPVSNLNEMRQKTLQAIKAGAKIIIWQEFSLTLESSIADTYLKEMQNLADKEDIYLLVSYSRILSDVERKKQPEKNMGILFTPQGKIGWEYAKAFPAPWEELMVESGTKNIPYLDTPYGRIGLVICADMVFPHYIRQAAVKNIDLLLVPSFDAPIFTPLFSFSSGYRAVENGFTMIRITGDGYSAVIDPYYREWAGQNFFEVGSRNFYVNVPVVSKNTFYAKIGFIFPYFIVLFLISLVVSAIIRTLKNR